MASTLNTFRIQKDTGTRYNGYSKLLEYVLHGDTIVMAAFPRYFPLCQNRSSEQSGLPTVDLIIHLGSYLLSLSFELRWASILSLKFENLGWTIIDALSLGRMTTKILHLFR
jgi:hypothetical protein